MPISHEQLVALIAATSFAAGLNVYCARAGALLAYGAAAHLPPAAQALSAWAGPSRSLRTAARLRRAPR